MNKVVAKQPVITLMLEARLADLLAELKRHGPRTLDERLLADLHAETIRLLRHECSQCGKGHGPNQECAV